MRDFKKILAWQKADDLVVAVYKATDSFPPAERFGLTSQMRRAVVSVAANIAEGSGRETLLDFRHFLHIARGSLQEVEYYIHLAGRLSFFSPETKQEVWEICQETARILQGLINSINDQISKGRKTN